MSYTMAFGKHEGRAFEWLFFKQPAYVQWIYENGIHRQDQFGEEEGDVLLFSSSFDLCHGESQSHKWQQRTPAPPRMVQALT